MQCFSNFYVVNTMFYAHFTKKMKQRTLLWNYLLQETDLIILCHAPPDLIGQYIFNFIEQAITVIWRNFQVFKLWTACFALSLPKIMKQRTLHWNDLLQETDLIILCRAPPIHVDTSSFSSNQPLTGYAVFFKFWCCEHRVLRSFYQK